MIDSQTSRRQARFLINTVDISKVPVVIDELKEFSRVIDSSKELKRLFLSPVFSDEEKERALDGLLSYMKAKEETKRFLNLLVKQGGISVIKDTINLVIDLYHERVNRISARILSAVPLNAEHVNRFKETLRSLTQREVEIETEIDPSIIGGFIVKTGSTIYDSSLKGQLMLLRRELTK